jgi:hypothetical protein
VLADRTTSAASASPINGTEPNIVGAYSAVEDIVENCCGLTCPFF